MDTSWSGADEGRKKKYQSESKQQDLADFYLKTGEISTAIEYFTGLLTNSDSASRSRSETASILRKLAICYSKLGKCDHALELLDKAFAMMADGEDSFELANVIGERGWVHFKRGEYDLSQADLECCLDIYLDGGLGKAIASTYNRLGGVFYRRGELDKATDLYRAALVAAKMADDRELVGVISNNLGLVCKNLGRWSEARKFFVDALLIANELGQQVEKGIRLSNIGIVLAKMGDWRKASRCWNKALKVLSSIGNRWDCVPIFISIGRYHLIYRDFEAAEEWFERAVKESADGGDARSSALSFEAMGDLHMAKEKLDLAEQCYREAMDTAMEIAPNGDVIAEVVRKLAELEMRKGNYEAAMDHAARAISIAKSIRDPYEVGCAIRVTACVEARLGEFEKSKVSFKRAIDIFSRIQSKVELALTYLAASESFAKPGDWSRKLATYLQEAAEIFSQAGLHCEHVISSIKLSRIELDLGDTSQSRKLLEEVKSRFAGRIPSCVYHEMKEVELRLEEIARKRAEERLSEIGETGIIERMGQARDLPAKIGLLLESCARRSQASKAMIALFEGDSIRKVGSIGLTNAETDALIGIVKPLVVESLRCGVIYNGRIEQGQDISCLGNSELRGCLLLVGFEVIRVKNGCLCLVREEAIDCFEDEVLSFTSAVAEIIGALLTKQESAERVATEIPIVSGRSDFQERLVTVNRKMLEILDTLNILSRTQATVLIEGETGTGKEMIARAIHELGDRRDKPFVTIDCSALSEDILESELFGHVAGAFTDAKRRKRGLFEEADGGTVFLDEIDKTSKKFQYRLLQVVDKHQFKMVGATDWQKADFRLICATNRDLGEEAKAGRFLEDLYYRLKVISLKIPPLRHRREDIALLAQYFLETFATKLNKRVKGFSPEAMDLLMDCRWPGNVRQLKHEIERAVTFCDEDGMILPRHFSDDLTSTSARNLSDSLKPIAAVVEDVERELIKEAIRRFNGNKSKAARSLGLSRRGLLSKIQRYRIEL
ncbi:MAG: sigma 54-interacting transcriptional regulator [bacterium]